MPVSSGLGNVILPIRVAATVQRTLTSTFGLLVSRYHTFRQWAVPSSWNTLISLPGTPKNSSCWYISNRMTLSGHQSIPAADIIVDRSWLLIKPSKLLEPSRFPPLGPTMGFSINTTKPLSAKPEKKKLRRRTKRDKPDPITGSQVYRLASAPIGARTNHRSLLEAVSQREFKQPALFVSQCTSTLNPGSGAGLQRSNAAGENQSPGPGSGQSYRQIAYNEYLAQAFGLAGEDKGDLAEQPEDLTGVEALPSTQSDLSTTSMELSFRLSLRERRPKIQLTIPRTRSKNYAAIPQEKLKGRTREGPDTSKTISPPSTTSHHRVDSGGAPAKLSIVSPLSVVEMPKPRRPFTTFSFEEMTEEASSEEPLLSKSAISDSSDDTGDHDGKSSSYSARSSVSSLASDPAAVKSAADQRPSLAFSVMSPTAAGVFDPKSKVPSPPRAMRSMTSLQDGANRNKPLPPAPGPGSATPWSSSTHPFARTNSMKTRHKSPAPLCVSRQSTMSISSRMSLRSKYTPTDLSDIDNALQPGSPRTQEPCRQTCPSSPTLSQAELELEAHLCSIEENVSIHTQEVPLVDDPLQISRGPMHMEPSRKPPPLPPSPMSTDNLLKQGKKQTKKLVTHVAMQMRPGNELDRILRKRVSAPAVGSNDKAHRVLGRSCKAAALERHASAESRWESSESPHSSPNTSMDDSETPTSERSPLISDAAFEEVRQRLELLSPKNDASQVFQEFHEQNFSNAGATARPRHEASVTNPLDDTKSVKSSSRQIAAPKGKQRRAKPGSFPPVTTTPAPQEHHAPLPKPRTRYDQPSPHYRGSIAAFKLTEIHASLPSPRSSAPRSLAEEERERMISAEAAEKVLLCILENLDNLQDLFATATVSRGFYRTFKRHELHLMMNSLYAMSPAAWELREMSPPLPAVEGTSASSTSGYTPTLYLQHYMTDMYTMIALKSVILVHCESFLRADTITALAGGERASQIDDAFWRVWTFCRLFGCGTNREDDIVSQMDWLRGGVLARQQRHDTPTPDQAGEPHGNDTSLRSLPTFGQGNRGGLTAEELYDMTEIWTCLGVLVSGFQGKRELAREFGIFDNPNISGGDVEAENAALGIALDRIQEPQLTVNRGVDLPPPYACSTHHSRCNIPDQPHCHYIRPCSLPRIYHLVTTIYRHLTIHISEGGRFPCISGKDVTTPSG